MKRLNQKGDTIVEVLIAIAVVSTVLVAAYQTTGQNIRSAQATQERTEALKLAEGQLERLRSNGVLAAPNECFDIGTGLPESACDFTPNGAGAANYKVRISESAGTYKVSVIWEGLTTATENVSLYYRPTGVMP
jgi:prepilin-type N-terminal cleavage/methylation domain-containing protein